MPEEPPTKHLSRQRAAKPNPSRRRPEIGGQPRSEETRAGLIAAALEVFGEAGFACASTRAIARRAKVTLPVLAYHFGGKQGLYLACAQHIAAQARGRMTPALGAIAATLARPDLSHQELKGLLIKYLSGFIDRTVGHAQPVSHLGFLLREQANPGAAFDILYADIMSRGFEGCAALVGRLLDLPADRPEVRLRAIACLGQVFMFRTSRAAVLRMLGWQNFEGDHLEAVRRAILTQVEAIFATPGSSAAPGLGLSEPSPAGSETAARAT